MNSLGAAECRQTSPFAVGVAVQSPAFSPDFTVPARDHGPWARFRSIAGGITTKIAAEGRVLPRPHRPIVAFGPSHRPYGISESPLRVGKEIQPAAAAKIRSDRGSDRGNSTLGAQRRLARRS